MVRKLLLNRSNDVSVRTNRIDRYKNQSENKIWLIFSLTKNMQTKGWC